MNSIKKGAVMLYKEPKTDKLREYGILNCIERVKYYAVDII